MRRYCRIMVLLLCLLMICSSVAFGIDDTNVGDEQFEECEVTINEDGTVEGLPEGVSLEEVSEEEQEMLEFKSSDFNEVIGLDGSDFMVDVKPAVDIPDKDVKEVLDEYFEIRKDCLTGEIKKDSKSQEKLYTLVDSGDKSLRNREIKRLNMKVDMENLYDISIVDAEVYTNVESYKAVNSERSRNTYEADVYEWTWIYYKSKGSDVIDRMGYGISHNMTVKVDDIGKAEITENDYDDTYVFDYNDCGEALSPEFKLSDGIISPQPFNDNENEDSDGILATTTYSLALNKMIDYADTYVKHDIANSAGVSYSAYYNTEEYAFEAGNDCANYVSQCLRAGGLEDTSSWYCSAKTSSSTIYTQASYRWRTVDGLITEFAGSTSNLTVINDNNSNIYPGNPVITNNCGHVAICVGYNGSGNPIINGHTRDVYHQLVSKGSSAGSYYYTIPFFTENKMGEKPSQATSITPTSSFQSKTASIPKSQSKYYKFYASSSSPGKYTFKFNNTTSGKKMYAVLYRATHSSSCTQSGINNVIYLYEVQRHNSTTNTPVSFNMDYSGSESRYYYLRFFHKYGSTYGLNFSYKFVAN